MKAQMKRVTALILALCMCLSLSQLHVWATDLEVVSAEEAAAVEVTEVNEEKEETKEVPSEKPAEEPESKAAEPVSEEETAPEEAEPAEEETAPEEAEPAEEETAPEEAEPAEEETAPEEAESAEKDIEQEIDYMADVEAEDKYDDSGDDNEYESGKRDETECDHRGWYVDSWVWSDDCQSCYAIIKCDDCDLNIEKECSVSFNEYDDVYEAEVEYNNEVVSTTKAKISVKFFWSGDYSSCRAEWHSNETGEDGSANCTITMNNYGDGVDARASVDLFGREYHEIVELIHVSFKWAKDLSKCDAVVYDERKDANSTINCTISQQEDSESDDTMIYTAQAEYEGYTFKDNYYATKVSAGTGSGRMWYRYKNGNIDIRGIKNDALLQTTFADAGYETALKYGDGSTNYISFNGNNSSYVDDKLSVTPNVTFTDDGAYTVVTYTVKNISNASVQFSLGMSADVDITGNDEATLEITNTGVRMTDPDTSNVYYLACRNVAGLTNVDTLWIGYYSSREDNVFNNSSITSLTNEDSGLACSWKNRTLASGATARYAFEVGIGEGDAIEMPEEHTHSFTASFNWANDYSSCTAKVKCSGCDLSDDVICNVTSAVNGATTTYTATAEYEGKTYTDTKTVTAHEHSYTAAFTWAEDYSSCNAKLTCNGCDETSTVACRVTSSVNGATTTYTATAQYEGKTYTDTKTVTAHEHSYTAAFTWAEDFFSCSAKLTCSGCDETATVACRVTSSVNGATTAYTATAEYEGKTYTDTKSVTAHKHTFTATFTWAEDYSSCNANLTCSGCEGTATVACRIESVTDGATTTYTATAEYDGKTFTDTQTVTVASHDNYDVTFQWAEDGSVCNITYVCTDCGYSDQEIVTPTVTRTTADCTTEGQTVYTASITISGKEYSDSMTVTSAALGHDYDDPTFQWTEDYDACEATFTCQRCNDVQIRECEVEEVHGEELFIATVEFDGETYTDIPPATVIVLEDSTDGDADVGVHYLGSGDDLSLECNIPLEYFVNVEVDGVLVDPSNYTLEEGSTILTFSSAYLDTLHTGTHDVKMNYNINGTAIAVTTRIKIQKEATGGNHNNGGTQGNNQGNTNRPNNGGNQGNRNPVQSQTVNYGPVRMTAHIIDANGAPMSGYSLEIHSTPMTSAINDNGQASFAGVEAGDHTLYLKDANGNTLATKEITIEFASGYGISGSTVKIIANNPFILNVQYDGENLILLSVEGDSPKTGDDAQSERYNVMMGVSFFGILAMFALMKKKEE